MNRSDFIRKIVIHNHSWLTMCNYRVFDTEVCVCVATPPPHLYLYYELIVVIIGSGIFCYAMGILACVLVGIVRGARTGCAEVIFGDGGKYTSRPGTQKHLTRLDWQRGRFPHPGPRYCSTPIRPRLPTPYFTGPQWLPSDEDWDL